MRLYRLERRNRISNTASDRACDYPRAEQSDFQEVHPFLKWHRLTSGKAQKWRLCHTYQAHSQQYHPSPAAY